MKFSESWLVRGHLARRLYQVLLVEELERRAAIAVQAAFRGLQGRRRAAARRREAALQYIEAQARTIERLWRGHLGRKIARAKRQEVQAEKEEAASLIIQCWYRRHLAVERAQFLRRLRWVTRLSARVAVVQAAVRRVLTTRTHLENLRKENEAKVSKQSLLSNIRNVMANAYPFLLSCGSLDNWKRNTPLLFVTKS